MAVTAVQTAATVVLPTALVGNSGCLAGTLVEVWLSEVFPTLGHRPGGDIAVRTAGGCCDCEEKRKRLSLSAELSWHRGKERERETPGHI